MFQLQVCADAGALSTRELGVEHLRAALLALDYGDCGWRAWRMQPLADVAREYGECGWRTGT